ncbi:MAG: hypothetical protein AB2551_11350 [Candidatus Thiodiazotropha sp.]
MQLIILGGYIGVQIGSMVGGQIGQMLCQMIGQLGQQNIASGLGNCVQKHAANVANQRVDNCGMPQFIKDEMGQFIQSWMQDNMEIMEDNTAGFTMKKEGAGGANDQKNTASTDKQNNTASSDDQDAKDAKRDEFIQAQSRYQANMQMFNMIANMTATSLKSLGGGLTAIARKQ